MASQPIPMDPKYIIDLVVKRRWIVMIPFFLAMIIGIVLSVKLPRVYQASTLILIQPQRVPENYVQSIVDAEHSDRINTLSQQVLSRTNLENIISEFNLFADIDDRLTYMEDKITDLRERISVDISSDNRRESDAFSISFQDEDPEIVMKVTNALASYFIDENLRQREAQAIGTSDFLDAELQNMKTRLEEVEALLKGYRESYMGALPEQLESNLRILDRLQEHMGESQQNLSDAKIRLVALQNEAVISRDQSTTVIIGQGNQEETNDLDQMKAQLENLLTRYTARHPDVVRLKVRIEEIEKQAETETPAESSDPASGTPEQDQPVLLSPEYRTQYAQITQEIRRLDADIVDTQRQIGIYQKRVEDTPKREQQLLALRRDYQNIQTTYDSLLSRKLEAEIAVNMERKQKGEQFRILDPAKQPQKPIKPDMKKLFILVVGAGLAVGGGIIFLLEYVDNSFKRPEDIEADLDLPVLCSVPQLIDRKTRIIRWFEYASCAVFGLISLVLFAGFAVLTQKGVAPTLELVRKIVNL